MFSLNIDWQYETAARFFCLQLKSPPEDATSPPLFAEYLFILPPSKNCELADKSTHSVADEIQTSLESRASEAYYGGLENCYAEMTDTPNIYMITLMTE